MHAHPPDEQFIPLSKAADIAGVTPEHLNLLAREGKLQARKIGRNWFTTKRWIDEYFQKNDKTDESRSVDLSLRQIEKEEKLEVARIQAEVQKRQIEKEERIELAKFTHPAHTPQSKDPFVVRQVGSEGGNFRPNPPPLFQAEAAAVIKKVQEEINRISLEKKRLIEFFNRELAQIRDQRVEEEVEKQALFFAFENLQNQVKEDIDRRVAEVAYQLNDRLTELIISDQGTRPRQLAEELQAKSQTEINKLKEEKQRLVTLFVTQLTEIKENLKRESKQKDQILKEFLDLRKNVEQQRIKSPRVSSELREELEGLKSGLVKGLEKVNEQTTVETGDRLYARSSESSEKRQVEKIGDNQVLRIGKRFAANLQHFSPNEPNRQSSQPGTFQTVFLVTTSNKKKKNLQTARILERKLVIPEWHPLALHAGGVHFVATHARFDRETASGGSFLNNGGLLVKLAEPSFAWGVLAVLLFGVAVFPFFDTRLDAKISGAAAQFGMSELFMTRVGTDLGELVVDSLQGGLGEFAGVYALLQTEVNTNPKNIILGSLKVEKRKAAFLVNSSLDEGSVRPENGASTILPQLQADQHSNSVASSLAAFGDNLRKRQGHFIEFLSQPLIGKPSAMPDFVAGRFQKVIGLTATALNQGLKDARKSTGESFGGLTGQVAGALAGEQEQATVSGGVAQEEEVAMSNHESRSVGGFLQSAVDYSQSLVVKSTTAVQSAVEGYFNTIGSAAGASKKWLSKLLDK